MVPAGRHILAHVMWLHGNVGKDPPSTLKTRAPAPSHANVNHFFCVFGHAVYHVWRCHHKQVFWGYKINDSDAVGNTAADSDIIKAIDDAIQDGVDIINASFGGSYDGLAGSVQLAWMNAGALQALL